ncbi:hypothetical protein [Streptomyces sp. NBC_00670]|jgi:hypothetical protein|uniref:hypothetical protein n=1 Tax=Streptomyces sp. NBC_00670 TaxID=2975804 RepID=UPI002E31C594|nr:hypothetical protein [Streptomyces sp. NBC_00670]
MAGASIQVVLVRPLGQVTWRRPKSMVKSSRVKPVCSFFCHAPLALTGPTSWTLWSRAELFSRAVEM